MLSDTSSGMSPTKVIVLLILFLLPYVQVMDLPTDVWGNIGRHMDFKEWAEACGTSRASYAARRQVLAAEVRSKAWKGGRVKIKQLRLNKWSFCHSLFLNLQGLHGTGQVTLAQIEKIGTASIALPLLRCLHIIGRPLVPVTENSVEGVLISSLARHASVLTLQVRTVITSLDFPNLQHLVLKLGVTSHKRGGITDNIKSRVEQLPSISMLKHLKTLYVQSFDNITVHPIDLTKCMHLQHVAVQNTLLIGGLLLPDTCLLHTLHTHDSMGYAPSVALLISGLTMRLRSPRSLSFRPQKRERMRPTSILPAMQNLKQLRIILTKGDFGWQLIKCKGLLLQVDVTQAAMPSLEVLELDVQGDLSVHIDPEVPMKTLVLVAAGSLHLNMAIWSQLEVTRATTIEQMYMQSSTAFAPLCKLHCIGSAAVFECKPDVFWA